MSQLEGRYHCSLTIIRIHSGLELHVKFGEDFQQVALKVLQCIPLPEWPDSKSYVWLNPGGGRTDGRHENKKNLMAARVYGGKTRRVCASRDQHIHAQSSPDQYQKTQGGFDGSETVQMSRNLPISLGRLWLVQKSEL